MEDLLIIQKIEDMMRYGYQAVAHFPKSERHVMSQEIRLATWRVMRGAVLCAKRYHKKTTLCDMDADLELLRRQIRMAKDLGILPFKKYEIWARHLDEIGRIVGSWLKKVK
jgi:hypothetical protein